MDAARVTNPLALPEVPQEEFDQVFEQLKSWGQYSDPSRGAWGTVGPDKVREAAGLVSSGRTAQMALPWNTVSGIDKQAVGEAAANIRKIRKPEPYKGKGVRYADEVVILKETKKK